MSRVPIVPGGSAWFVQRLGVLRGTHLEGCGLKRRAVVSVFLGVEGPAVGCVARSNGDWRAFMNRFALVHEQERIVDLSRGVRACRL